MQFATGLHKMVNNHNPLDEKDRAILLLLQQDARLTNAELARRVDLSPTGLQKRLKKLEENGLIRGYVTLVDHEAVGYDLLCFVQVTLMRHDLHDVSAFRQQIGALDEILECHHVTGEYDYLLKVVVRNRAHLEQFLMQKLTPVPGIDKIRTSIVLREIKSTTALPLGQ
jgi:DNA-binding Lrp family transcriptional regulator